MSDSPSAVYRRFVDEVVVGKRVELLDELFDPGAQVPQGSLDGLRAAMQAQATGLDVTVEYLHELVQGDWVVSHMDLTVTHSGEFLGHPGTGASTQLAEVEAARVVGGRIVETWSVADQTGAMLALGIPLPEPGAPGRPRR